MLGLRELRSEVVSSLSKAAMEVLGFEGTPEHRESYSNPPKFLCHTLSWGEAV